MTSFRNQSLKWAVNVIIIWGAQTGTVAVMYLTVYDQDSDRVTPQT